MIRLNTGVRTAVAAATLSLFAATTALAHHGWNWTTGGNIALTGIVASARLGNPHGVVEIDAEGEMWTVEVGQPWRNSRAGLTDDDFAAGTEMTIEGEPSADVAQRRLKAERITIAGEVHELYPERS